MKSLYLACLIVVTMIVTFAWIKGSVLHLDLLCTAVGNTDKTQYDLLTGLFTSVIYIPFWSSCYSGCVRLCQFYNNAYWPGQDYLLDSQLVINPWRLVISSSIDEGVEDVRCLNWFCFWVITAHFFNKSMDGMKS